MVPLREPVAQGLLVDLWQDGSVPEGEPVA